MRTGHRRAIFAEINITPLTDIFLVLLIIMMVVAPMLDTRGLKVSVPSMGPSPEVKTDPKTIRLGISAAGEYSVEGATVSRFLLSNRLRELKSEKPDGVLINTNPEASHEALTYAMDAVQSAGVTKVAVSAENAAGQ
jgi:biopolymer transport protein ExbD/biopolymer transport protein TolR